MPELLYKPVVPDFSEVGSDVQQIGQQVLRYKQQKERYKRERRDMLMKHYMAEAQVQPYDAIRSKNQEMVSGYVEQARQELKPLAEKIDAEGNDWKHIQEARQIQSKYQQKINQVKQWEKTYLEDRKIIEKNTEEYAYDSVQSTLQYRGGPYQSALRKKTPMAREVLSNYQKELFANNEASVSVYQDMTGKVYKSKKEAINDFWNNNGQERNVERQQRAFQGLVSNDRKLQRSLLKEMREFGEVKDNGKVFMPDTEKTYGVQNIAEYAYDKYKNVIFPMKQEVIVKEGGGTSGSGGGSGIDKQTLSSDHGFKIEKYPFTRVKGGQYIPFNTDDRVNIEFDVKNPVEVDPKKGTYNEVKGNKNYENATIRGVIVDQQGNKFVQLGANVSAKFETRKGKPVYKFPKIMAGGKLGDFLEGTKDQIRKKMKKMGLNEDEIENNMQWLQKKRETDTDRDILVPLEQNNQFNKYFDVQYNNFGWVK